MNKQYFYGHGKLLLTGEYLVLDGAKALALPCKLGQKLHITYRPSNDPKLYWKSYDANKDVWFEAVFELWRFNLLSEENEIALTLQKLLRQARKQNIHFLRDNADIHAETELEFPVNWGLGSSSTLIYNIAQWAYISPYELLSKTFGGSGYDICCAQSMGPITYQLQSRGPSWEVVNFNPVFKDKLYFVYLNKKQNSQDEVISYRDSKVEDKDLLIKRVNSLTEGMLDSFDLTSFEEFVFEHENLVAKMLGRKRVQDELFPDFWGSVKSLGAWGGDFVMVTSNSDKEETKAYFKNRGFNHIFEYDELILQPLNSLPSKLSLVEDKEKVATSIS